MGMGLGEFECCCILSKPWPSVNSAQKARPVHRVTVPDPISAATWRNMVSLSELITSLPTSSRHKECTL